MLLQKLGIRHAWAYLPAGLVVWAGAYLSGIHPTLAGVVIGLLTPVHVWEGQEERSPVERLQDGLHGWVAYVIMPVFALANAGVPLGAASLDGLGTPVLLGVTLGLVIGKPVGIVALSWLAVRMRVAALPTGVRWPDVLTVGMVAGIGFTMALFIASLAFPPGPLIEVAKLGILCASAVAGVRRPGCWVACCWRRPPPPAPPPARRRPRPRRTPEPNSPAGGGSCRPRQPG